MATVLARVIRRAFNRIKDGILTRHRVGEEVQVSERELARFSDRLQRIGSAPNEPNDPGAVHRQPRDLLDGGGLILDTGEPSPGDGEATGDGSGVELPPLSDSQAEHVSEGTGEASGDIESQLLAERAMREERIARVNAAGDVQALRLLAYEFNVDVSNRWTADKTRKEILSKL